MYRILFWACSGASSKFAQKSSQSNETSTAIKDSEFVDNLYIDWPVTKQQYASNADIMELAYQD